MSDPIMVDLVLDNGGIVRIECPDKFEDELHDSIKHALARGDWWGARQFDGCQAWYLGLFIDRVNMARVVATL